MTGRHRDDKPDDERPAPVRRRDGGGLKPAADLVPAILAPVFRRRGFAQHAVVARWAEVVGPMLAAQCRPERLQWPRDEAAAGAGAVLHLVVAPGWATEVQHLTPQVIERVNRFFGWAAVASLRLRQAPLRDRARPAPPVARALTAVEAAELDRLTAGVTDPAVRVALRRLGAAVFADDDPARRR